MLLTGGVCDVWINLEACMQSPKLIPTSLAHRSNLTPEQVWQNSSFPAVRSSAVLGRIVGSNLLHGYRPFSKVPLVTGRSVVFFPIARTMRTCALVCTSGIFRLPAWAHSQMF